jgi:hypothetical protein
MFLWACQQAHLWLLNPDPHSKWKILAKNFAKLQIFEKTSVESVSQNLLILLRTFFKLPFLSRN